MHKAEPEVADARDDRASVETLKRALAAGSRVSLALDTNVLDAAGKNPKSFGLAGLEVFVKSGIELVFPDVWMREWQAHIFEQTKAVRDALRAQAKNFNLLRSAEAVFQSGIDALSELDIRAAADATWSDFVASMRGIRALPTEGGHGEVMDRYFSRSAPFNMAKRKAEFPDAYAVVSLLRYALDSGRLVVVVSNDGACLDFCDEHEALLGVQQLASVTPVFRANEAVQAELALMDQLKRSLCVELQKPESSLRREVLQQADGYRLPPPSLPGPIKALAPRSSAAAIRGIPSLDEDTDVTVTSIAGDRRTAYSEIVVSALMVADTTHLIHDTVSEQPDFLVSLQGTLKGRVRLHVELVFPDDRLRVEVAHGYVLHAQPEGSEDYSFPAPPPSWCRSQLA